MTEPRLFRVILPVTNIEVAASFFADVLDMPGDRVSPGRHYFPCGGTILACYDALADGDPAPIGPNPQHLYFSVDDLEAVHERVRGRMAGDVTPIETRPWGERSFYANDPFGNPICFVDSKTVFTRSSDWPDRYQSRRVGVIPEHSLRRVLSRSSRVASPSPDRHTLTKQNVLRHGANPELLAALDREN